eukprot:m.298343 g.298343  ORF g.298343 m.298343 type:complete len:77 (+) comp20091_c0_seq32:1932-2162(+)
MYLSATGVRAFVMGIVSGFNGCLSTQSTFVFELRYLAANPTRALSYAFYSIGGAQALLLLTMGIYKWGYVDHQNRG